ncbi:Os01g0572700 [Oryza sativa Japonica Group]|uniref:Os01g0572700 protein n=1 Tax=Oryza sativa subsp. japonica TaxID=39947 RepID=A0A0P0V4B4_ORYSJ|nr:hypothetical protein EE612_003614 [Oryza sativa]BAS72803.1 Os01g0572700 [Oryza sativa Japonica Group]
MPPPPSATAGRRSPFSALLLYVTFALVILLLLTSYSPSIPHRGRSLHRRLKLHPRNPSLSGAGAGAPTGGNGAPQKQQNHHHAAPFDPEIAELERRLEDKEWEREHYRILHGDGGGGEADEHMREWEEFLREDEDFINDDERSPGGTSSSPEPTSSTAPLGRWSSTTRMATGLSPTGTSGLSTTNRVERLIRWGSHGGKRSISMLRMQMAMVSLIKPSLMTSLIPAIQRIPKLSICSANKK